MHFQSLNRTVLELKRIFPYSASRGDMCLNRTVLELKQGGSFGSIQHGLRLNRTVLELKLNDDLTGVLDFSALIVPYWN